MTGYPIGLMNDAEFEEHTLLLPPGSRLYLYSDGITDVFGENGEAFGEERLRNSLDSGRSVDLRACVAGTGKPAYGLRHMFFDGDCRVTRPRSRRRGEQPLSRRSLNMRRSMLGPRVARNLPRASWRVT